MYRCPGCKRTVNELHAMDCKERAGGSPFVTKPPMGGAIPTQQSADERDALLQRINDARSHVIPGAVRNDRELIHIHLDVLEFMLKRIPI